MIVRTKTKKQIGRMPITEVKSELKKVRHLIQVEKKYGINHLEYELNLKREMGARRDCFAR